jgi:predicted dithiol-disulfide oxidoreductase (DUF899 family)
MTNNHKIVSSAAWIEARKQLLIEEKEFNRLRDRLSQRRRELPWEAVDEEAAHAVFEPRPAQHERRVVIAENLE